MYVQYVSVERPHYRSPLAFLHETDNCWFIFDEMDRKLQKLLFKVGKCGTSWTIIRIDVHSAYLVEAVESSAVEITIIAHETICRIQINLLSL